MHVMKRLKLVLFLCSILFKVIASASSDDIKEKCELYLPIIRNSFRIVIPDFNARKMEVVFKTGRGLSIPPTNPIFVPFLHHYYVSGTSIVKKSPTDDKTLRSALLLYFNIQYTKFLKRYGIPLSCLSFYTGSADERSVNQLQQLYSKLNQRFGNTLSANGRHEPDSYLGSLTGKDISDKLQIVSEPFHETDYGIGTQDSKICEKLFIELKDGSMQAKMPVLTSGNDKIGIPGTTGYINANQVNITYQLSRYFHSGLTCLSSQEEKISFSSVVYNWLSQQIIPSLVQKSTCVRGYPRIFQFMNSIDSYLNGLSHDVSQSTKNPPSVRKQRKKRSIKREANSEYQPRHNWNQMGDDDHDIHRTLKIDESHAQKVLYDHELKSLYDRLNGHFLRNNLQIARLDIVELPHPELYHHKHVKQTHPTTTTTTTTTTTPTTTTEEEEIEEEEEVTEEIVITEPTEKINKGHRVKVVGEFEVNEDNLYQPMSVSVDGKKLRAQLDVSPLATGNNNLVVGHPVFHRGHGIYHNWHFGVHNYTGDEGDRKALHAIHYLLKKKYGPDPNHKDFVQKIADSVGDLFTRKSHHGASGEHHHKKEKSSESQGPQDFGLTELKNVEREIPPT